MSFLEKIASKILTNYLGEYVEGLDSENLSLNVSKGDVVLNNLRFKKSALQDIELPVTVNEGLIGKISLQIPWSSLGSKPAIVKLENIFLLVGPKQRTSSSAAEEEQRALATKKKRLQLAELLGYDKPDQDIEASKKELEDSKDKKKDDGFVSRLVMKVVDNLQIFIDKIHIRYEDQSSHNVPFAFGITVEHLHAQSTDGDWRPTFLNVGQDIVHKLVTLKSLAIYWNVLSDASTTIKYDTIEQMVQQMDALIHQEAKPTPSNQYIIEPISGFLKAKIDRGAFDIERPRMILDFDLNSLALSLNAEQYRGLISTLDYFNNYAKGVKYLKFKASNEKEIGAKVRWKYALDSILHDIQEKRKTWSWEHISKIKRYRQAYINLYKKKKKVGEEKLTKDEKAELERLEVEVSYDNLVIFRKIANTIAMKEKEIEKQTQQNKGGFFGRFFGGGSKQTTTEVEEVRDEDVWKEVYNAVGYTEKSEDETTTVYPKEYEKTKVFVLVQKGSFELREAKGARPVIARAAMEGFSVDFTLRDDSNSLGLKIDSFNICEYHTLKGTELDILTPHVAETPIVGHQKKKKIVEIESADNRKHAEILQINVDVKPLDANPPVDLRVKLKTQPILIKFSRPLIDKIVEFFSNKSDSSALQDIGAAASNRLDSLTKRAQAQLKYALEQKKTVLLNLDMSAPTIIVPQSFTEKKPSIVLDFGRVVITSDPHARDKAVEYKEGMDVAVSEEYFYDTFKLSLTGLHALIAEDETQWTNLKLLKPKKIAKMQLVNKFDMNMILKVCNVPAPELPKIKFSGKLPSLQLFVSQDKVQDLFSVLRNLGAPESKPIEAPKKEEPAQKMSGSNTSSPYYTPVGSMTYPSNLGERLKLEDTKLKRGSRRSMSRLNRLTQRFSRPILDDKNKKDNNTNAEKSTVVQKNLEMDFEINEVVLNIDQLKMNEFNKMKRVPFITLSLRTIRTGMTQTSAGLMFALQLRQFLLDSSAGPIIDFFAESSEDSLSVRLDSNPKPSPLFNGVDHRVAVHLGNLRVNFNRAVVAQTILLVNEVLSAMSDKNDQPKVATDAGQKTLESIEEEPEEELPANNNNAMNLSLLDAVNTSVAKVRVVMKSAEVNLMKDKSLFLMASVQNAGVDIDVKQVGDIKITGYVGKLNVKSSGEGLWTTIVSIEGDRVVHYTFEKFNEKSPANPGWDIALKVELGALRFVFTNKIVKELAEFFSGFSKMRELLSAATAALAAAVASGIQAAGQQRIKLDIDVNNPFILVPRSSLSKDHLLLDLGKITLSNKFIMHEQVEIDQISVMVSQLKAISNFGSVTLQKEISTQVIKDTNIKVILKRAIAHNENHVIPDIDLLAEVTEIELLLSEAQSELIFGILTGNMSEQPLPDVAELQSVLAAAGIDTNKQADAVKPAVDKPLALPSDDGQHEANHVLDEKHVWSTTRVVASLAKVSLTILKDAGIDAQGNSTAVANFAINGLQNDLDMFNDGQMKLKLKLQSIVLYDRRAESSLAFNTLLTPVSMDGENQESQISVQYESVPHDNRMSINVGLYRPRIYLLPDSLLAVKRYLLPWLDNMTRSLAKWKDATEKGNAAAQKMDKIQQIEAEESKKIQQQNSVMDLVVLLTSPELCVLENPSMAESSAFVLHLGDSRVRMVTRGSEQQIDLQLTQFDAHFCRLKAESHAITSQMPLLQPFNINLNMAATAENGRRIAINVSPIDTIISYSDIKFVLQAYESWKPLLDDFKAVPATPELAQAKNEKELEEAEQKEKEIVEIPIPPGGLDKNQRVIMTVETKDDELAEREKLLKEGLAPPSENKVAMTVVLNLGGISFSLLNDKFEGFTSPLLKMALSDLEGIMTNYTIGKMEFYSKISTLLIDAYNNDLSAYEPVIEPWSIELEYDSYRGQNSINITSDEMLNMNLTKSFIDLLFNTFALVQEDFFNKTVDTNKNNTNANKNLVQSKRQSFNPYTLKNEIGKPIKYWWSHEGEDSAQVLESGDEIALVYSRIGRDQVIKQQVTYLLSMRIVDPAVEYEMIRDMPVGKVGNHLYRVSPAAVVVGEVIYEAACKTITLRSAFKVVNKTQSRIELLVENKDEVSTILAAIPPGSSSSIPIDWIDFNSIRYKPDTSTPDQFEWSDRENNLIFCRNNFYNTDQNNNNNNNNNSVKADENEWWFCAVKETTKTSEVGIETEVTLSPPIIIENLLASDLQYKVIESDAKEQIITSSLAHGQEHEIYYTRHMSKNLSLAVAVKGFDWSEPASFSFKQKSTKPIKITDSESRALQLSADFVNDDNTRKVSIYSNYWIINNTGLRLMYKSELNSKKTAAGQSIDDASVKPLVGDPNSWYPDETNENKGIELGKNTVYFSSKELCMRVENSSWSKAFPLGVQNEGLVEIKDESASQRLYQFSVVVYPAPGRFWRTKLVKIYPGFMLVNQMEQIILYKQKPAKMVQVNNNNQPIEADENYYAVKPGQQIPFHWPNFRNAPKLSVKFLDESGDSNKDEQNWSTGFAIDQADHLQLKLRNSQNKQVDTLAVHIKVLNGTTFVVFGGPEEVFGYQIQNNTNENFILQQKGCESVMNLNSGATAAYCWDEPQLVDKKLIAKVTDDSGNGMQYSEISLEKIGHAKPIRALHSKKWLVFEVKADGPTRVLHINEADKPNMTLTDATGGAVAKEPKQRLKDESLTDSTGSDVPTPTDSMEEDAVDDIQFANLERKISIEFKASLKGLGMSVVDTSPDKALKPKELLYITAQTIYLKFTSSNVDQTIEFSLGTMQIDNQLYLTPYPIVLFAKPAEDKQFLSLSVIKDARYNTIQFLRYFAVQVQEMDLSVDQTFLVQALAFASNLQWYLNKVKGVDEEQKLFSEVTTQKQRLSEKDLASSNMFYFELLHINPIKANVSFMTTPKILNPDIDKTALERILGVVGTLANVEEAPLALNGLMIQHLFSSQKDLVSRIVEHFKRAGLKQAYKIVGSADFLGSPVNLVNNLGTGVYDFFHEPAKAIVRSPAEFGLGLAKGTGSLLKNTTYAIFNTASKITSTVAKVGETLTMDEDYQRDRAIRKQKKAQHVGEGFVYGITDFGIGLYKGITGVVTEPIKGATKEGGIGFLKGLGRGLTGVVLKPTVGAIDLVSRTTEGIKNTTTMFDEKAKIRVRPPRFFGADHVLGKYNLELAIGQELLSTTNQGKFMHEYYDTHAFTTTKHDHAILGTKRLLCYVHQTMLGKALEDIWIVKLSWIKHVMIKDKRFIVLKYQEPGHNPKKRTIECDTPQLLDHAAKKIMRATGIKDVTIKTKSVKKTAHLEADPTPVASPMKRGRQIEPTRDSMMIVEENVPLLPEISGVASTKVRNMTALSQPRSDVGSEVSFSERSPLLGNRAAPPKRSFWQCCACCYESLED